MKITLEKMLSWNPCYGAEKSTRRWLRAFPSGRATPLQVARTKKLPVEDRLWCLLREDALPEKLLHRFACDSAQRALELYGGALNEDQRDACQHAIDAKPGWLAGVVDDDSLAGARDSAWAAWDSAWAARAAVGTAARDSARAAWDAVGTAARAAWAAGYAARDSAGDAAGDVAWAAGSAGAAAGAAGAAERKRQLEHLAEMIEDGGA